VRIFKRILVITLAIILLLVTGIFAYLFFVAKLPDTEGMQSYFSSRQAEFERINTEIILRLKAGQPINSKEYKKAGYLGVEAVLNSSISIKYYTHRLGVGLGVFGRGIAYLGTPPNKLYPSLEAMVNDSRSVEGFVGYGRLSNNWYYFSWELD
jgi:hypothetical protein